MRWSVLLLALLVAIAAVASPVFAQDSEELHVDSIEEDDSGLDLDDIESELMELDLDAELEEEDYTGGPRSASDVEVHYHFAGHDEPTLVAGEKCTLLVSFENKGQNSGYNVTHIATSIVHPQDFNYYIQNFTAKQWYDGVQVAAGEHYTFSYEFIPHESFDPREFGFIARVWYADASGDYYMNTFFNDTIPLIEAPLELDVQSIFTNVIGGAVALLVLFVAYKIFFASGSSKRGIERGTKAGKASDNDNEWLVGTSADQKKRRTPTRRKQK
eukprot:TRINITY_DN479_c1_g3_i1.p1 TRINITY_DN479_c1_g3~~TRINITY_DN479_c1_g3_i1.p1  ORF type:complete len:310 (-),score=103.18 TRINITY_DN479_c1_g3_i1:77-892(-)